MKKILLVSLICAVALVAFTMQSRADDLALIRLVQVMINTDLGTSEWYVGALDAELGIYVWHIATDEERTQYAEIAEVVALEDTEFWVFASTYDEMLGTQDELAETVEVWEGADTAEEESATQGQECVKVGKNGQTNRFMYAFRHRIRNCNKTHFTKANNGLGQYPLVDGNPPGIEQNLLDGKDLVNDTLADGTAAEPGDPQNKGGWKKKDVVI